MNIDIKEYKEKCDVCGAAVAIQKKLCPEYNCRFCGFRKLLFESNQNNDGGLLFTKDINQFFKNKYTQMNRGETFELSIPVRRIYKRPKPVKGQINFFKSKNIMFLLEQHGFQMVSRKSRFSTHLQLVVRKV